MFQVTPDQEKTILIGDMLSDGLLVVELPPSPASTPALEAHPSILLSGACGTGPPADTPTSVIHKRGIYAVARNMSYGEPVQSSPVQQATFISRF